MSLRRAINSFCRQCIYDEIGGRGSWRMQVQNCSSKKCPLYEVRPNCSSPQGPTSTKVRSSSQAREKDHIDLVSKHPDEH